MTISLTAFSAALAGFLFGFDTANMAGVLPYLEAQYQASTVMQEWLVAITVLAAALGCVSSGKWVHRYGRKTLLLVSGVFFIVGTVLAGSFHHVSVLFWGRFLIGIGIGISSFTAPMYLAEIAPAKWRGFIVLLNGIAITSGESFAYLSDYAFNTATTWRWMFWIGLIPALLFVLGLCFLPESPRWLMQQGHGQLAKAVLRRLRKSASEVASELALMAHSPRIATTFSALWRPPYRQWLVLGVSLGVLQQFFGINAIFYYGPTIFSHAQLVDTNQGLLATLLLSVVNTLVTVIACLTVDRFGRRKLLLFGSLLAGFSLLVIAEGFHSGRHAGLLLPFFILYIVGYCLSVGSLFWLIISEIFPIQVRAQAVSLAAGVQWLANFVVSVSFLTLLTKLGPANTLLLYGGICFFTAVFVYYRVPETRGVALELLERQMPEGIRASANQRMSHATSS